MAPGGQYRRKPLSPQRPSSLGLEEKALLATARRGSSGLSGGLYGLPPPAPALAPDHRGLSVRCQA